MLKFKEDGFVELDTKKILYVLFGVLVIVGVAIGAYYNFSSENGITWLFIGVISLFTVLGSFGCKPDFYSSSCVTTGLVGTVLGFMVMSSSFGQGIDIHNQQSVVKLITDMGIGMGLALQTTLAGQVGSWIIDFRKEYK